MGNRIIKETIRTSKTVNSISDFLFRFWIYLITYVDDYGRGSADPQLLKGFVFPRKDGITEHQITEALEALANKGMIHLYESDGELYFCFPKWDKHQQIRAKKSRFPAPDGIGNHLKSDEIKCPRNPIQYESNPNPNPNTNSRTPAREAEQNDPDGFETFWEAYPRKTGDTRTAYMEYREAINQGVSPETMIAAAKDLAENSTREDFNYLPAAEKWIRNKGWLESKARKKVSERESRGNPGKPENGAGAVSQFDIRYDVE